MCPFCPQSLARQNIFEVSTDVYFTDHLIEPIYEAKNPRHMFPLGLPGDNSVYARMLATEL